LLQSLTSKVCFTLLWKKWFCNNLTTKLLTALWSPRIKYNKHNLGWFKKAHCYPIYPDKRGSRYTINFIVSFNKQNNQECGLIVLSCAHRFRHNNHFSWIGLPQGKIKGRIFSSILHFQYSFLLLILTPLTLRTRFCISSVLWI
jgi:hypothetical protein